MHDFKWTGEFCSRVDEDRFLSEAWPNQAKQIRFTVFIGGILYFSAIIANFYNLGFCLDFAIILFFRGLVLLGALWAVRLSFRKGPDPMITGALALLMVMVCAGELVEMVCMGAGTDYYTPAMIPMILIFYLFLPIPLAVTTVVSVILSLSHALSLLWYVRVPPIHLTTVVIFFTAANGLGIFFVRRTNLLQRREYQAMDRLKEALAAKDVFLATMSHEFRTPLNAIIGLTDLTLQSELPLQARENLRIIQDSAGHLKELVDDLLDLARIESGRVEIVKVDLDLPRLLEAIAKELDHEAEKRGLELRLDIGEDVPPILKGDLVRLRQVLVNLVGNALKFTENGLVAIRVDLQSTARNDGLIPLRFSVIDTGVGIPGEKQQAIFERFNQADDSTTRRFGGTGLGLAITRHLVELMGGSIQVDSELGRGSCFSFELSFEPGNPESLVRREREERIWPLVRPGSRVMNILLAEDNPLGAKMMIQYLSAVGFNVKVATTGGQVLENLLLEPFDLVLMDIEMPEMDGLEAARRIRSGEAGKENQAIKIVAVTAHALPIFQEKARKVGIEGFLTKPLDFDQMNRILTDLFPQDLISSKSQLSRVRIHQKHLLPELMESLRTLARQATRAAEQGDFQALRRTGHSIKGVAASFRIYSISEVGKRIEECGAQGVPLNDLETRLNELLDALEAEIGG